MEREGLVRAAPDPALPQAHRCTVPVLGQQEFGAVLPHNSCPIQLCKAASLS